MTLSDKIKFFRNQKGLSQKEITAMIDMNQAQYSRIESGKVEPTLSSLKKIAAALDISLIELLDDEDPIDVNSLDASFVERVHLLEELDEEERKSIFHIIDIAIAKKRMKDNLGQLMAM